MERDAIKWNSLIRNGKKYYFSTKGVNYLEVIDGILSGNIPELVEKRPDEMPDLRDVMIEYGQRSMEQAIGDDWKLVKLVLSRMSMDEILNTFYEKSMALSLLTGKQEPMSLFFRSLAESGDDAMITLGNTGLDLISRREELSQQIQDRAAKIMPNATRIIGTDTACQLLAHFGSMERLAMCKSSSIQMAGAERSLFMSKTKKIRGPKYGLIYRSPVVSGAKPARRGTIARKLSNVLSICFRADCAGRIMGQDEIDTLQKKIR